MSHLQYRLSAVLVGSAAFASAADASDSPSPVDATVTDRIVTFRWPEVEGAVGYAIQVRYDHQFADDGRSIVHTRQLLRGVLRWVSCRWGDIEQS
jgi:hypothetical protein